MTSSSSKKRRDEGGSKKQRNIVVATYHWLKSRLPLSFRFTTFYKITSDKIQKLSWERGGRLPLLQPLLMDEWYVLIDRLGVVCVQLARQLIFCLSLCLCALVPFLWQSKGLIDLRLVDIVDILRTVLIEFFVSCIKRVYFRSRPDNRSDTFAPIPYQGIHNLIEGWVDYVPLLGTIIAWLCLYPWFVPRFNPCDCV